MVNNKKSVITKKEAATVQLETAIKLLFENRDLLSAYTLCSAANGILEGIYKNKRSEILAKQFEEYGKEEEIRFSWNEEWELRLKPEHRKEGFRLLNATQNFLKHADKDHDDSHEYWDWEETGVRIFMAFTNYRLVFRESTPAMNIFFTMYALMNPSILREDNPLLKMIAANPLCENIKERFSQAELAAIGYANLERDCPELFPPTDISSNLDLFTSRIATRVPYSKK